MDEREKFFGDLTSRIYNVRNAIVHSASIETNKKGTINITGRDLHLLLEEINMIRHFALEVVSRSYIDKAF